jgi:hypothetical protein
MVEQATTLQRGAAKEKFERADWLAAVALFAISLLMRLPFRSRFAYHWDSVQFALAIEHFNVSLSLPHRPGYFLFIMLGRLVNMFVGDPHASLMWVNVGAGAALVALGYLLGTALFGRACGWITAGILATSPLCWFQSEVVFSTLLDSVLVVGTVLVCWRAIQRRGAWPWVLAMATMLALEAGVRQQTTPMLCPVWLYTFWKFPAPRWRKFLVGVLVAGLLCAAWFIPMAELSGGIVAYLRLYPARMKMDAPLTPFGGGYEILIRNLAFVLATCWIGLLGAAVLAGAELYSWLMTKNGKRTFLESRREELWFVSAWIVPMVLFGIGVITVMPGYVLCYFPGVVILVALVLSRLAGRIARVLEWRSSSAVVMVVASIAIVNIGVFVLPLPWTGWLRGKLSLTVAEIRDHDRQLDRWFQAIRTRFRPDEILICHDGQSYLWGFRHFQYYLPEYENVLLTPDHALPPPLDKKLWYTKGHSVEFVDKFEPRDRRKLLLVVPPGGSVEMYTNIFNVASVEKWDIPQSAPLYILTTTGK